MARGSPSDWQRINWPETAVAKADALFDTVVTALTGQQ